MKTKIGVLKKNVTIEFTPDEIWSLILMCDGYKVSCKNNMRDHRPGSMMHEDNKKHYEAADSLMDKIIEVRNKHSVIEEVEV